MSSLSSIVQDLTALSPLSSCASRYHCSSKILLTCLTVPSYLLLDHCYPSSLHHLTEICTKGRKQADIICCLFP